MGKILSLKQRSRLVEQHRVERDSRVRDRIKAVLAYDDDYSYSEIGKLLLLDDETIRRHVEEYVSEKKLCPENGEAFHTWMRKRAKSWYCI